jgi:hypothetical protein
MAKINGKIWEQVFSWFRHDAPTCNEMKELRHKLILFYYAVGHYEALLYTWTSLIPSRHLSDPSEGPEGAV